MKRIVRRILAMLNVSGRDWQVFLVSLLLAFSIWLFYNMSLRYQDFLTVPVQAKCNIEGHSAESVNKCDVVARCRTTGYNILRIRSFNERHPVVIPFSKMQSAGDEIFYVTVSELQEYAPLIYGDNTTIEYFLTDTLYFRFPYETYKKVPVRAVHELEFKQQYTLVGEMTVTPDSVTVYGEPYRLEKIEYVYTEPISATKLDSELHGIVRLEKSRDIRYSDESVRYSANVERYVEITATVPIEVHGSPVEKKMMVYPSSARVNFRCFFPYKINPTDSVVFYVDYDDFLASRSGKCLARTENMPADVINYTITPEVFECVVSDR